MGALVSMKYKFFLMIIVFILFTSSLSKAENIKIGLLLPYSGAVAILGEEITNALELHFEEVNSES